MLSTSILRGIGAAGHRRLFRRPLPRDGSGSGGAHWYHRDMSKMRIMAAAAAPRPRLMMLPPPPPPRCANQLQLQHYHRNRRFLSSNHADSSSAGSAGRPDSAVDSTTPTSNATMYQRTHHRTPVSWRSLLGAGVVAATAVAYYRIERERRLEAAMGQVVSSEYHGGWTPRPGYLAPREYVPTKYGWFPKQDGFGAPGKPAIGGPWSLVDLDGNLVTNKSLEGKWLLLYFGFARCPDICPSEMMKVGHVLDTLKTAHPQLYDQLVPVFVSVDPARDSLQALASYARDFHPKYVFLTGAPAQVQHMAKQYRVYVSKAEENADDYLIDHSIVIYFHDDTGDLQDCFTQSMRPSDVVHKVVERMQAVAASGKYKTGA